MKEPTILLNEDAMVEALKLAGPAAPPKPSTTASAWLALERRRRELETQLKTVVTNQEQCRVRLLDEWATNGISKESVDGYTIHAQRKLYPKVMDRARLAIALREAGLTDLLTVDEKAFAIYVTSCDENEVPLPDSIATHMSDKFERFAIVVRMPSGHAN